MTEMTVGEDGFREDILPEAFRHFTRSVQELNVAIDEIKAGDTGRAKDMSGLLSTLGKALQSALDERARVEKLRRHDTGSVRDSALDFDAARSEIGRRLALLRAAGSGR